VGLGTLKVISMLEDKKEDIDWQLLHYLTSTKVLIGEACNPFSHHLLQGSSGLVYALLLIVKTLKKNCEYKRVKLLICSLTDTIAELVESI
jgi:hypothetical protein